MNNQDSHVVFNNIPLHLVPMILHDEGYIDQSLFMQLRGLKRIELLLKCRELMDILNIHYTEQLHPENDRLIMFDIAIKSKSHKQPAALPQKGCKSIW